MELDVNALPDSEWETCVSAGIALAQNLDAGRWGLGDLALTVERRYGQDSVGKFSSEIGMAKAQTLRDYARVARRFPSAIRNAYSDSPLTFSHFRATIRAGEDAELWLARAADDGLNVAELARQIAAAIGQPVPPRLLWSGRAFVANNWPGGGVMIVPKPEPCDLPDGLIVTVKVYEGTGAE
jgi:hypothetical protein